MSIDDILCRKCQHMRPDKDGSPWCYSPQLLRYQNGRGARCIFERDGFNEGRNTPEIHKCGRAADNFVERRGAE
jgi:hypothetical protein